MRIAMFGGSFNPVHIGHVKLVEAVINEYNLDRVIIMPTYHTPLKDNSQFADSFDRYEMCRLAFEDIPKIEVSDMEIKRQGNSYTYLTLNSIKEIYPESELFLIVGADMFMTLDLWKNPGEIFRTASVIAIPRDCEIDDMLAKREMLSAMGCKSLIFGRKVMHISSTEVRNNLQNGLDVKNLIDNKVEEYIRTHHLYGT